MAYPHHFAHSGFQSYAQPTTFAAPQYYGGAFPTQFAQAPIQQFAVADASEHEGSQVGGEVQSHSVSGFAAQPIDAGFGGFYGVPQATFIGGHPHHQFAAQPWAHQATVIPTGYAAQQTILPAYGQLVPQQAVRRPGYNERLVAWRNRQKAFNRYKATTKRSIKDASQQHYVAAHQAATVYGAPQHTVFGHPQHTVLASGYGAAPATYGQTFIGQSHFGSYAPQYFPQQGQFLQYPGAFVAQGEAQAAEQQYGGEDFTSYSSGANAAEIQQEEPEIRGTQV